ncbi:hypothetical protein CcCBS67573_g10151 [Chytriomyces confervae]|uniref:U4/U6.U5 small nuclear ribonucleoprotein 27kDa protein domain-containing protein n=1 Tax=Chytriomyces confervae TaxID=246404 RepID=A0A507DD53_9FUNG|nr:hypothetical protein CcCBS67573_g10151 [Chytriomyces confervae]
MHRQCMNRRGGFNGSLSLTR